MNAGIALCQCCGQPLPADTPPKWDFASATFTVGAGSVRLRRQEARFLDVLYRSRHRAGFQDPRALLEAAYVDDPNGGPESLAVVAVITRQIRQKIEPMGWTVTLNMGVPRRGYRLVRLPPP